MFNYTLRRLCFLCRKVLKIIKNVEIVETLKVNANYLSIYDTFVDAPPRVSESTHKVNFYDNFHDMQMSGGAVKSIKKAVNLILYLSRKRHFAEIRRNSGAGCLSFRNNEVHDKAVKQAKNAYLCTFLTLTLPATQQHTDLEITKYCINPFLSYARKYFKVRYFIWKKELQKNGNLHFHLCTDRFIDHKCLRRTWNRIINNGKVKGVEHPFDYVDRYNSNMRSFYSDGWNPAKVMEHIKRLDYVNDLIKEQTERIEQKENREITAAEYDELSNRIYNAEFAKWHKAYQSEMQLSETERWRNPNSTDIDAVKSPAGVSLYVAKYIAKDISDNPALIEYTAFTQDTKATIYAILRTIDEKQANGEDVSKEIEQLEYFKNALSEYRKTKCPIQGHLWFKSQTLTPFLSGASDFIGAELKKDLTALIDSIYQLQRKRNAVRRQQGKKTIKLIIRSYANDTVRKHTKLIIRSYKRKAARKHNHLIIRSYEKEQGLNILCTTLLFNVFDFMLEREGSSFKYPALRSMWQRFIADCILYNKKRGLYEF